MCGPGLLCCPALCSLANETANGLHLGRTYHNQSVKLVGDFNSNSNIYKLWYNCCQREEKSDARGTWRNPAVSCALGEANYLGIWNW